MFGVKRGIAALTMVIFAASMLRDSSELPIN